MQLNALDWAMVAVYGVITIVVGLAVTRRASSGTQEFFLSGRSLPWYFLGISLVATTFSTDTPNLVTDLVRTGGVSQNWVWWAFCLTGMCTVFFYARYWRRSEVLTDIAFYELRYSGKPAAFLRGFRAVYLGLFFNAMIMASVNLAAIKIAGVLIGLDKYTTVIICSGITALYAASSGLRGVVLTDVVQFGIAMLGAFAAAYYAVIQPEVGGLAGLFSHPNVTPKLSLLPDFNNWDAALAAFIIPVAVQWWSTWYPGSEPGGGGYVAQRMLAARNEKESLLSTLLFNILHYGLRPWPWIIVALASLIIYPDVASIQTRFPHLDPSIVRHDLAYPAMLVYLPHGMLGIMVASLAAAYMSTVSTQLNWGASYLVDDFYRRFIRGDQPDKHYVGAARVMTFFLVAVAAVLSLWLENAYQAFQIMLQVGAGTGLIYLLRWFWWRVNAWSEISGMTLSFLVAMYFQFIHTKLGFAPMNPNTSLVLGVLVTTVGWLVVTFLTPPTEKATLQAFYDRIRPLGKGWANVVQVKEPARENVTAAFLCWFLGCVVVYAALFGTGSVLYGQTGIGLVYSVVALLAGAWLLKLLPQVGVTR